MDLYKNLQAWKSFQISQCRKRFERRNMYPCKLVQPALGAGIGKLYCVTEANGDKLICYKNGFYDLKIKMTLLRGFNLRPGTPILEIILADELNQEVEDGDEERLETVILQFQTRNHRDVTHQALEDFDRQVAPASPTSPTSASSESSESSD